MNQDNDYIGYCRHDDTTYEYNASRHVVMTYEKGVLSATYSAANSGAGSIVAFIQKELGKDCESL